MYAILYLVSLMLEFYLQFVIRFKQDRNFENNGSQSDTWSINFGINL